MSILLGNGGVKEVKEIYVGVDGKPRKVKDGYIGVDGTPRKFYSAIRPLEEYSWAEIRRIADAGLAPRYFKLGDMKSVHIQGTVGKLEVNNTFYVYILGFDHNGAKNTIDFGTFKTADGKDICLIDGQHSRDSEDGTKWFNMNHSSNTNAGGWKSCDLRYDILGSVNAKDRQNASSTLWPRCRVIYVLLWLL